MSALRHFLSYRLLAFACAAGMSFWTQDSRAQGGTGQPLADGWWNLSLDEIRAGDSRENTDRSASVIIDSAPTQLELQEMQKLNQAHKSRWMELTGTPKARYSTDPAFGGGERDMRRSSSDQNTDSDPKNSGLLDYTTSTSRALQKAGTGGTNQFRPLPTSLPVNNLNMGLFNRREGEAATDAAGAPAEKPSPDQPAPPTTADAIASLPGSTYYGMPSSPLDVVKSSVALPSVTLPVDPTKSLLSEMTEKPNAPASDGSKTAILPIGASTNATPGASTATAKAANVPPPSISWVPGTYPQQGFQPAGTAQPFPGAFRRASGPNASGFYEPKSISDLQMGR